MQKTHEQVFDLVSVQFVTAQHGAAQSRRALVLNAQGRGEESKVGESWDKERRNQREKALVISISRQRRRKNPNFKEKKNIPLKTPNFRDEKCQVFSSEGRKCTRANKSTFAAAGLCFEIATSIAGLKQHIYSYFTASEELSSEVNSTSISVKAHTLPDVGHSEEEKNVGRYFVRILDALYRYPQTEEYCICCV